MPSLLRRPFAIAALLALAGAALGPAPARAAEPLVADLSEHLVAITTGFTGAELLLFGAVDGPGDVVVIVRGPRAEVVVRRKARTAGIWVNRDSVTFEGVPAFYHVAASAPLGEQVPLAVRERHQIGAEYLRFRPMGAVSAVDEADFRTALIRNKRRADLYSPFEAEVDMLGGRLFRTGVTFPANVPVGTYTIETLLIHDGEVVSAQTTPLFVSKVGFGARIFRWASENAALYGIAAILIACIAGLSANWIFRKL